MPIDAASAALAGAAIGAFAGVAGTLATVLVTQWHESRRHLREITIRTALRQWMEDRRFASERNVAQLPLSSYVVQMTELVALVQNKRMTPEKIVAAMRNLHALSDAVEQESIEHSRRNQERDVIAPDAGKPIGTQ